MSRNRTIFKLDWVSVFLFIALVMFGWLSIYSTTVVNLGQSILDLSTLYGKQLLFIILSFLIVLIILSIESKFYERFSSIIYILSLLSLLGLLFFGKTINGQTAWYSFGSFSIQPAEFAKAAVALAIAKYLSELNVDLSKIRYQFNTLIIILLPISLILLQPDAGSASVFFSFFIAMYREGLPGYYIWLGLLAIALFVLVLLIGSTITATITALSFGIIIYYLNKKKEKILPFFAVAVVSLGFIFTVNFIYNKVLKDYQKQRFEVLINLEENKKGSGYNLYQSIVAIGSGGLTGKGFLEGYSKQGGFVPEQETDYIFTSIAEEWGFIGSLLVISLFIAFMLRILFLAERQKKKFSRVYGYSVFGIFFIHFFVNLGMVMGLVPTIGIPLPLFSYGGSGLWGFTILVFIFLKLDAERQKLGS
jgi:rod shape determining protein RodA